MVRASPFYRYPALEMPPSRITSRALLRPTLSYFFATHVKGRVAQTISQLSATENGNTEVEWGAASVVISKGADFDVDLRRRRASSIPILCRGRA